MFLNEISKLLVKISGIKEKEKLKMDSNQSEFQKARNKGMKGELKEVSSISATVEIPIKEEVTFFFIYLLIALIII